MHFFNSSSKDIFYGRIYDNFGQIKDILVSIIDWEIVLLGCPWLELFLAGKNPPSGNKDNVLYVWGEFLLLGQICPDKWVSWSNKCSVKAIFAVNTATAKFECVWGGLFGKIL
jgi:hypothetical protein